VLDLLVLWYRNEPRQFGDFEKAQQFFAPYNQQDPSFRDDYCLVATAVGANRVDRLDFRSGPSAFAASRCRWAELVRCSRREDARGCSGSRNGEAEATIALFGHLGSIAAGEHKSRASDRGGFPKPEVRARSVAPCARHRA
jgi:hypothetical protein